MRILTPLLIPALIGATISTAQAQRLSFDPSVPCADLLLTGDAGDKTLSAFWASGYLAKTDGKKRVVDQVLIEGLYGVLKTVCQQAPEMSFQQTVDRFAMAQIPAKPTPPPAAAPVQAAPVVQAAPAVVDKQPTAQVAPARPEQPTIAARVMLQKFFDPNADRAALTAALKPTEADIRAVYSDPLANALITQYDSIFKPGIAIGPKPEHTDIYSIETTTQKLKNHDSALRKFPGGYKKVIPFIHGNNVIVRFKFVRAGETLGLAFDGLIFVNGRWVLMPKPWRAIKE